MRNNFLADLVIFSKISPFGPKPSLTFQLFLIPFHLSNFSANLGQNTLQYTAEKRGLNYYSSKDNFYSFKINLETLVSWAKTRLKAQF